MAHVQLWQKMTVIRLIDFIGVSLNVVYGKEIIHLFIQSCNTRPNGLMLHASVVDKSPYMPG